ncbi:MAG: FAD/NAD(P)-binding oxidoreductase [Thiobacillaceae bacterium]|jgi:sulfide:quinone oxidoreductase
MKNIVILGAGTGGALISNLLSQHLDLDEWQITVIDRSLQHVYQPGLLFIPFGMYDYKSGKDICRDILDPLPKDARFVAGDIKLIDHEKKLVETDKGNFSYDFLVSTMGCHPDPGGVQGLSEALGMNGVHTFYDMEGAAKLQGALDQFKHGRLVIDICEMPIKYPVASLEFAFLADYYFHLKGIRDRVEISLATPFAGAFIKPNANRVFTSIAEQKGIKVVPNFTASALNADKKKLYSSDGRDLDYDLLVTVPRHAGPEVLDYSELSDGNGYALTDPTTLKSKRADFIFCMGDNANVSSSKAASVAYFEADTVLENLLCEMEGKPAEASFDGHSNCFIESGYNKALLIDFNCDMEPLEGSFPMPHMGPMSLLKESRMNHVGKLAFKWVYWNLLLPGRMSSMPFLAAHMNFRAKQHFQSHLPDGQTMHQASESNG